jgi:hypothetical protein
MPGLTEYVVNKIVDHAFRGVAWTPPSTYYLKPHLGDPTDAGTGFPSAVTTRQLATLSASTGGLTSLTADVHWTATARETWSHVSVWDDVAAGHCVATIPLESAINVYAGDVFALPALSLQIPATA